MIQNIGIDIIENKRIKKNLLKVAKKILHKKEFDLFGEITNPKRKVEFLAGRWAAKEAIFKCLDEQKPLNHFAILYEPSGRPYVDGYEESLKISISHENRYSTAVAIKIV